VGRLAGVVLRMVLMLQDDRDLTCQAGDQVGDRNAVGVVTGLRH
jgi:hypothetical protein